MLNPERCLAIDIDGVLCVEAEPYSEREPVQEAIDAVRTLYLRGWHVTLYTGRHHVWAADTTDWLTRHHVPYHHLVMGKPPAKYYIDDRAINVSEGWPVILNKLMCP